VGDLPSRSAASLTLRRRPALGGDEAVGRATASIRTQSIITRSRSTAAIASGYSQGRRSLKSRSAPDKAERKRESIASAGWMGFTINFRISRREELGGARYPMIPVLHGASRKQAPKSRENCHSVLPPGNTSARIFSRFQPPPNLRQSTAEVPPLLRQPL